VFPVWTNRKTAAGCFIIILVVLSYAPALNNGYIWDDDDYVTHNTTLRSAHGLYRMWFEVRSVPQYYPLVHTTYWLEYRLWGLNPLGYHLVNILLHGANALLLFLLLRKLSVTGAWFAAALFALHPVHVESVAWITERKNVLSAFFYLLAMLAYCKGEGLFDQSRDEAREEKNNFFSYYILSLLFFICALLSKTVTCSFPAAVLLALWWKRGRIAVRDCLLMLPFFTIGAGLGLQTVWVEKYGVGARGDLFDYSMAERFLIAGRALWFYLEKLFWPRPLMFFYPRWHVDAHSAWQYAAAGGFTAGLAALIALRRRLGRGAAAAMLFFSGTLFPALGFFNVAPMRFSFVADHFQYLASIGPLALFAAGGATLFQKLSGRLLAAGREAALVILVALGVLVWQQCAIYRNEETLWRDTIAKNEGSWIARMNLGKTLFAQGRTDEALACYRTALSMKPDMPITHCNLGGALAESGDFAGAEHHFKEAIRRFPDYGEAYYNLGILYARQGKDREAEDCLLKSLKIMPESAMTCYSLGHIYSRQGEMQKGAFCYARALRLDPGLEDARVRLEKMKWKY